MAMKIGSSTLYALLSESPADAVRELQKNGIEDIELVWEYRHSGMLERQAAELRKTGADFSLHLPFYAVTFAHPDPEMRRYHVEAARKALLFAESIRATPCVIHGGALPEWYLHSDSPMRMEDFYDSFAEQFRAPFSRAKRAGIKVAMENLTGTQLGVSYKDIAGVQERLPDMGFCLDVPHAIKSGGTALLNELLGRLEITHVHVTDSRPTHDDHSGVGRGQLPIRETVQKLEAKGYKGKVIFEGLTLKDTLESVKKLREMAE